MRAAARVHHAGHRIASEIIATKCVDPMGRLRPSPGNQVLSAPGVISDRDVRVRVLLKAGPRCPGESVVRRVLTPDLPIRSQIVLIGLAGVTQFEDVFLPEHPMHGVVKSALHHAVRWRGVVRKAQGMPQFVHEHRIEVEDVLRMIEAPGTVLRAWSAPTVEFNVCPINIGTRVYSDGELLIPTVIGGADGYLPRLAWQVSAARSRRCRASRRTRPDGNPPLGSRSTRWRSKK